MGYRLPRGVFLSGAPTDNDAHLIATLQILPTAPVVISGTWRVGLKNYDETPYRVRIYKTNSRQKMKKIQMLRNILLPRHSSNQRGFTLVEIMVAIGIMSTISLALIKMNEMMNKTSKNMSQQLDATQLMTQLNSDLKDSTGCFNTFGGRTLANGGVATDSIRNPVPNTEIFAVPGGVFGDLTFVSATFRDVGPLDGVTVRMINPASAPATMDVQMRTATVRFQLRKGKSANAAADHQQTVGTQNLFKDLTFKFYVLPGSPTIIRACSGNDTEYIGLACDLFEGTLSGTQCRNITVRSVTTTTGVSATFTDRVAIARTAAPAAESLLEVGSGTYPFGALAGINVAAGGNSYISVSDNVRQVFLGADTSNYGMVGTLTNHDFVIRANNTERVRVSAAGDVGIGGIATAGQRLHVFGNETITGNLSVGGNAAVTGQSTLTGDVNTNTQLRIGGTMAPAFGGLCYKGTCITSWNVQSTGVCTTVFSASANSSAFCPTGSVVTAAGVSSVNTINLLCCPFRVF